MLIPQDKMSQGEWGVGKMTKEQWNDLVKRANDVVKRELAWNEKQPLNAWGNVGASRKKSPKKK